MVEDNIITTDEANFTRENMEKEFSKFLIKYVDIKNV